MARRPLAVVQFGQYPDGILPDAISDEQGWGATNPVPMYHLVGVWPAFSTFGGTWLRTRGHVSAGRLVPPPTTGVTGQVAAAELVVDVEVPAAGRWECQLATGGGLNDAALSQFNAGTGFVLHAAIGLTTLDGLHGIALFRSSSLSQVLVYTWDASSGVVLGDVQVPTESDDFTTTFDAQGLVLAIEWAGGIGAFVCTANGIRVGEPRTLPVPTAQLRPILIAGRYKSFPDQYGITWAALTEAAALPARSARPETPTRSGWSLHAADRWGTERDEIRPDTWTWTDRLFEPSTVSWSHAVGGPKITAYATHALVCHRGHRYHAGPVTTQDRSHGADPGTARSWSATDRRGQLNTQRIYPTHRRTFDGVPLREVLESLLGDTQHLPGGDMGIRVDPDMDPGPAITLDVDVRTELGAAIRQALDLAGGEWTIDRHDLLRWYPDGRGGRRDWIAHIASADEHLDGERFGTALWVTGADQATAVYRQARHIDRRAEGRIDLVLSDPDVRDPSLLAARADLAIAEATVLRTSHTVELVPGTWDPSMARAGDTCRLIDPPLGTDEWVRIYEIAVTITSSGKETVKVTYGAPTPSFWRDLARQRRDIDRLTRR